MSRPRYATRLNSFKHGDSGVAGMIRSAGKVAGLDAADLNYPDHFARHSPAELIALLAEQDIALNGLAMRYYSDPGFRIGAFTNPDPVLRQAAIDLTRKGLDALAEAGGKLMTLWLGQDGVDYSFQGNYQRLWDDTIQGLSAVADHNRELDIAIEYKPNEPRAFALIPDAATTLLAVREVDKPNLGVTLDFAHSLYAGEIPAHAASLINRHSRLLGVHLNDGYARRDDGLMVGTVHPLQTVELFVELDRIGYGGVIYFDTFPDANGMDPAVEADANIKTAERLRGVAAVLAGRTELAEAIARQDAAASMAIVAAELYGK